MIYLLRISSFSAEEHAAPGAIFTHWYEHIEIRRVLSPYLATTGAVGEIGPLANFGDLNAFANASKCVIDPYNNAGGAGLPSVPENLPYPVTLFRCLLGGDSGFIPDAFFDLTFSISVIEHIGQKEANYDCHPTDNPPREQEVHRESFCRDLFRVTKPGGVTVHTVDHAARNLSFIRNFSEAGFVPLQPGKVPTVDECLNDPDAVRQRRHWTRPEKAMPPDEIPLHGVLLMAFKRER